MKKLIFFTFLLISVSSSFCFASKTPLNVRVQNKYTFVHHDVQKTQVEKGVEPNENIKEVLIITEKNVNDSDAVEIENDNNLVLTSQIHVED